MTTCFTVCVIHTMLTGNRDRYKCEYAPEIVFYRQDRCGSSGSAMASGGNGGQYSLDKKNVNVISEQR